jgi:hypothetical protein
MKGTDEMSTMSEATTRRGEEAAEAVIDLLNELGIELFSPNPEPGDSFCGVDVLAHAMFLAVASFFMKNDLPPPPLTEINEICAEMFMRKAAH